ncbi:F-box and leucine-rich repeat protein 4 [Mortierella sp. GBA30]|nr:F-box and leucine-rich repeat protein 4 [Mortierella sp. GBA30]
MNAVATALSSQDILHHILSLGLLSQSDLRSCCLVNSDWATAGLILLWHYPQCHTLHSFRLLLDTLRHEVDLSGPVETSLGIASTVGPGTGTSPETAAVLRAATILRRSSTMHEKKSSATSYPLLHTTITAPNASASLEPSPSSSSRPLKQHQHFESLSLLPTPYRPYKQPKEYGIPFHGQRIYHRAQFIRHIDFSALVSSLSMYHFEILARSSKIGFRSLDLRLIRLPFSEHLLSILMNSKGLRQLALAHMHIPTEALVCLEPCFQELTELRLIDCPDSMQDQELSLILQQCPRLRILEIHGESFTDESLQWIGRTCLDLETLIIEAPKMTDAVVEHIAQKCSRLWSWSLVDCTNLMDETMDALEQKYAMDRWSMMALSNGGRIANDGEGDGSGGGRATALLVPPIVTIDHVISADIHGEHHLSHSQSHYSSSASSTTTTTFSASSSSTISSPSSSVSSHSDSETSSSGFNFPLHHKGRSVAVDRYMSVLGSSAIQGALSRIEFRNCMAISPKLISNFLRTQPRLEHLILGGISITDEALDSMTEIPFTRLQSLGLYDCGEISDETMVALMFNCCDRMKRLTLFGSNFTLQTFSSISLHLNQLEELHLEHVPLIMNESIQGILMKCLRLRVLKLWHCRNLTQDLFTDQLNVCPGLEELEYMDKFPRPYADDGWVTQVRFLQSLVIRFEGLKVLRLAKLADNWVPVLDRLEQFTILQSPGIDLLDLKELKERLPTLLQVGIGFWDTLSNEDVLGFNQTNHRPCVRVYRRMLESTDELINYAD